ncbi:hypothetical protein ACVIGB_000777 [Bradyrhizobium sp. USDA 4341]
MKTKAPQGRGKAALRKRPGKILALRRAGPDHAVVTVAPTRSTEGESYLYRREPCAECPWRKDAPIGAFPPEAFRISADTAYDQSQRVFACHMSGSDRSAACAGFLLRGADHNIGIRLRYACGDIDPDTVKSDVDLYASYREMAEANGVAPNDPKLGPCR